MEIAARKYTGWKAVVRTDCKEPWTTLCFPSLDECPYTFPDFSPAGWSAYNSVLVYITTSLFESLQIEKAINGLVGIWWKRRFFFKDGDWIGMTTKEKAFPFKIPQFANAIVQIDAFVDHVFLETDKGTIVISVKDGDVEPYSWPLFVFLGI